MFQIDDIKTIYRQFVADFFYNIYRFLPIQLVKSINDLTMRLVTLILWYSPIGIFFLIAGQFSGVSLAFCLSSAWFDEMHSNILGPLYIVSGDIHRKYEQNLKA